MTWGASLLVFNLLESSCIQPFLPLLQETVKNCGAHLSQSSPREVPHKSALELSTVDPWTTQV